MYLDDDNWIEPHHIESLLALIFRHKLDWAYSLRNIVSPNGGFICRDDCQSLGWWPAYNGSYHHIDANCFFIRRSTAISYSSIWNRKLYFKDVEIPDRALCMALLRDSPLVFTTGLYTVNYRVGGHRSVARDKKYFITGNKFMSDLYKTFPWTSMEVAGPDPRHPSLLLHVPR